MTQYYSQIGQDKWVADLFKHKKELFFIDIGAFDGILLSNSYFLEKELNWNGICVEPNKESFQKLLQNRKCIKINKAIANYDGKIGFFEDGLGSAINNNSDNKIECITLSTLFKEQKVPKIIHYLSLDVEGAESRILSYFPFEEYKCVCITVEHNLYAGNPSNKNEIYKILSSNDYKLVEENVMDRGSPLEDWYIHKDFINIK